MRERSNPDPKRDRAFHRRREPGIGSCRAGREQSGLGTLNAPAPRPRGTGSRKAALQRVRALAGLVMALTAGPGVLPAGEPRATGIMDNSFFVEEAYNQEPGVVQHITTGNYQVDRAAGPDVQLWHLAFTQEWPIHGQDHQLSYTLPYLFRREQGRWIDGWGDIMIHYRRQVWLSPDRYTALAPRASVILPTGDADRDLGEETVGAEFNLPFSTLLGENAFLHANAGLTALPDAASARDRDLVHYTLAAALNYALHRDLHVLLEWVGLWEHGLNAAGQRRHEWISWISPGIRCALNPSENMQVVFGLAAPVGLTGSAPDYGVFLYLSVEHRLWRPR